MDSKRRYSKINPYDLTQVRKIMGGRAKNVSTRTHSDDPYSTSSSVYVKDKNSNNNKK